MGNATMIKQYNNLVRKIVTKLTEHYGIESPEAVEAQVRMYRMVRSEYPYRSQVRSESNG